MSVIETQREESSIPVILVRPSKGWASLNLGELWRYRELVYFFIWRDIKVRYKQTLLGAAWAIIQPFLVMVIFNIFFGKLANMPSDGIPYPIFAYVALLPWQLFENGVRKAGNSLVTGRNLLTKVYFPRLAIPIASVIAGLVDFALALTILLVMMWFYDYSPTKWILFTPLLLILALVTALGTGLWLSALNVNYRDIGYIIPFIIRVWFFLTPITYSASIVPEEYQTIYALNPMTGVIQGFRWAMLGVGEPPSALILASTVAAVSIMISGLFYFRRMERTFADVV
ncbi:MAG: ABC transporter permease [Anaerolineales bacterium]|nr:MAG: ABC transporter permease [Anaerolineales bacterium]